MSAYFPDYEIPSRQQAERAGFRPQHMGGYTMAFVRRLACGGAFLITDGNSDLCAAPEDREWVAIRENDEGQPIAESVEGLTMLEALAWCQEHQQSGIDA